MWYGKNLNSYYNIFFNTLLSSLACHRKELLKLYSFLNFSFKAAKKILTKSSIILKNDTSHINIDVML